MKPAQLYKYITLHRERWSVKQLCEILQVSESGYYRSLHASLTTRRQELLLVKIQKIIDKYPDNDNYGAKRVHLALQQEDVKVSYSTLYRIMKEHKLLHKAKRHPNGITREDAEAQKAENLIKQDFTANEPNQKWLTDITEVPCSDGKLYVAPILDCFNGEIVGLSMADNMRSDLCVKALEAACQYTGAHSMIVHSDRGSQFTSAAFRLSLKKHNAIQSMSGTGRCYDNARKESFFATLKKEKLYRINTRQMPMTLVKTIIFRYIMIYYNRQRIYTTNPSGWPPIVYRQMAKSKMAA